MSNQFKTTEEIWSEAHHLDGNEGLQGNEKWFSESVVKETIEKFSGRSNNRWTDKAIQDFLKMELGLDGEQK